MSALPHPSPQPPSSITQIIVRALRSHAQQDCIFFCYLFDLGISDESFGSSPCHIFVFHYSSRRYSRSYRDSISCFVSPVDGVALSWLKSDITNRQQRFVIDCSSHSKFQSVTSGVPQVSILSWILRFPNTHKLPTESYQQSSQRAICWWYICHCIRKTQRYHFYALPNEQIRLLCHWFATIQQIA